jgi:ABC-type nitrate/sulfonate/bicarbonate transport system substrate-binding protein
MSRISQISRLPVTRLAAIAALLAVVTAVIFIFYPNLWSQSAKSTIRMCAPKNPSSALIAIASERGYFQELGLDVNLEIDLLGRQCLEALENKKADFAVAFASPVIGYLINGHPYSVITEVHSSTHNTSIVFAKKGKIAQPKDLAGKSIALIGGTNAENLIRLFAKAHEIQLSNLNIVKASTPTEIQNLLINNKVDAAVIWEPFLSQIINSADHGTYTTFESSFYTELSVVVADTLYATANPQAVDKLVQALYRAQKFYEHDPVTARRLVEKRLQFSSNEIPAEVWPKFRLAVGLSAVLLSMMEQEAQTFSFPDRAAFDASSDISQFFLPQALRKIDVDLVTYE